MVRNSLIIIFIFAYSTLFAQNDLDKCLNLLLRSEKMILQQDSLINLLKQDIKLSDMEKEVIRKQNINCELTVKYLEKDLKSERKQKKIWQIIGVTGLSALLTTTILYITKP
jgi:hypothetical protein